MLILSGDNFGSFLYRHLGYTTQRLGVNKERTPVEPAFWFVMANCVEVDLLPL